MTYTRPLWAAVKALLVMTLLLGVVYPLSVTAVGLVDRHAANGSLIELDGRVVGSSSLGQATTDPRWFWARPSTSGHAGDTSGGSNLSPTSPELAKVIAERTAVLRTANPDATGPVPPDAVTASASGLDAFISLAYAEWQAPRVAAANGIPLDTVEALVARHARKPLLGFIGMERVNVTDLNVALVRAVRQ